MRNASAPSTSDERTHTFGPPSSVGASRSPDATDRRRIRRTAVERPTIVPRLIEGTSVGYAPTDPYVRRFWIPIVGPGAVADVLRLTAAARGGRPLRLPIHVAVLAAEGLITFTQDGTIAVPPTIPGLRSHQVARLGPSLRGAHQRHLDRGGEPHHAPRPCGGA
jgi:hypothetical protein